jgi:RNA polymerase-binding protein DksA
VAQKRKKTSKKTKNPKQTKARRLSAADINHFKEMLLEKRREILVNVNEMEDEALKKSRLDASGDLSSMPIHMADIGTDNYEQEFALGLMDSERKLLKEIDDALQRIEKRTYGICEGTGKPISKARLEAQPWARYCVEYARMLEQGLVVEQEQPIPGPQEYKGEDES